MHRTERLGAGGPAGFALLLEVISTEGLWATEEASFAITADALGQLVRAIAADREVLSRARRELHKFWFDCVWALTFPTLEKSEAENRCGLLRANLNRGLHECADHRVPSLDLLHDFIDTLCAGLHACLSKGEDSLVRRAGRKKRTFENRRGFWPTCREQLFPFGATLGVRSLLTWAVSLSTPFPLHLVSDILWVSHPVVFHEVMEYDFLRKLLLDAVVRRAGQYGLSLHRADTFLPPMYGDGFPIPPVSQKHGQANMKAAIAVLNSVHNSPDADPNSLVKFVETQETLLYTSLQLLLSREPDRSSQLFHTIASLAAALYTRHLPKKQYFGHVMAEEIVAHGALHDHLTLFDVLHRV
ncbi:hypothetical protein AURDEDRAFT_132005, partial [Auricularia subglabra TFB-10046 SS5]